MPDEPTADQIEAARHAGWDVGQPGEPGYPKPPPEGWGFHALDPGPVEYLEGPSDG